MIGGVHGIYQWLLHTPHDPNPACEKWSPCSFPIQLAAQRSAGGMGIEKDLDEMFSYDTVRSTRAAVRCDGLTDCAVPTLAARFGTCG